MSDQITALVRTWAAIAGGWVASFLVTELALDIDGPTVAAAVTSIITALWYALGKLIEARWPKVPVFVRRAQPTYVAPYTAKQDPHA